MISEESNASNPLHPVSPKSSDTTPPASSSSSEYPSTIPQEHFPRILFPSLAAIRTISNTRVDKPQEILPTQVVITPDDQIKISPPVCPPRYRYRYRQNDQQNPKFVPVASRFLSRLATTATSNTARDLEFSYDYEIYMLQIVNNPTNNYRGNYTYPQEEVVQVPSSTGGEVVPETDSNNEEDNANANTNTTQTSSRRPFRDDISPQPITSIKHPSLGLELLDVSDSVIVRQCHNPTTVVTTGFKDCGAYPYGLIYEVSTRSGSPIMYMSETTNCMNRLLSCSWIGCTRSLSMQVVDVCGKPSMTVTNAGLDCLCCCCLFCCCNGRRKEFRVNLAEGEALGSVCQTRGDHCNPGFFLKDDENHKIIGANGPKCLVCTNMSSILSIICCCLSFLIEDDVFNFTEKGGKVVAQIKKMKVKIAYYSGSGSANSQKGKGDNKKKDKSKSDGCDDSNNGVQNLVEDLDYTKSYQVLIDFAPGLSVKNKALILAASFIIDFLYWQTD